LTALALLVFAIGTGEYAVAGMLPAVAAAASVGAAAAGQLVTIHAAAVVVSAPLAAPFLAKLPHRLVLVLAGSVWALATLGFAAAPSFGLMLTTKVLAGVCLGAVFATGLVAATALVPPAQAAKAIGWVVTGLTLATMLGAPLGTFAAEQVGWRAAYAAMAGIGAVGVAVLAVSLPAGRPAPAPPAARQFAALRNRPLLATLAMVVLGYGGVFAGYTYLAPAIEAAGGGAGAVTAAVTAFGLGGVVGNMAAARTTARAPLATMAVSVVLVGAALAVMPATLGSAWAVAVGAWVLGVGAFGIVPPAQVRVLANAGPAPLLATATNVAAFNLANLVGAALGGVAAAAAAPSWSAPAGAVLAALGLAVMTATRRNHG
jgi:DHA1 family inner membrane transport protein